MSFTEYVAQLEITPGRVYAPFWSAFIQVLRNRMDHQARQAGGESTPSMISVSTSVSPDRFTISVENDGPGSEWDAVRKACESLGGFVEVESRAGQGARIGFAFPQDSAPAGTETALSRPSSRSSSRRYSRPISRTTSRFR